MCRETLNWSEISLSLGSVWINSTGTKGPFWLVPWSNASAYICFKKWPVGWSLIKLWKEWRLIYTHMKGYHQHLICILFRSMLSKCAIQTWSHVWVQCVFPQTKQAWIQSDTLIILCRRLWFYCLQIRSPANYHNSFIAICSNHVLQSNVRMNINLSLSVWRWNPRLLCEWLHCFGPSCTRWRLQLLVVLLSITPPPSHPGGQWGCFDLICHWMWLKNRKWLYWAMRRTPRLSVRAQYFAFSLSIFNTTKKSVVCDAAAPRTRMTVAIKACRGFKK